MNTKLIFGTSYLGDKFSISTFSQMYEVFTKRGYGLIDTAINYPINGNQEHFKSALKLLKGVGLPSRTLYVKVGGCQNTGRSDSLLNSQYLNIVYEYLLETFSDSLFGIGIHWDNRSNPQDISETLEFLGMLQSRGLTIGFSGVRELEIYHSHLDSQKLNYIVQHNASNFSSIKKSKYGINWTYGVSKMSTMLYPSTRLKLNNLIVVNGIDGVIIGPTNMIQLHDWLGSSSGRS